MLSKLTTFLDEKLSTPMAKLAEQRHLRAIRDGIIATLPLIIVSSMFMVIAFLPNSMNKDWGITQFLLANQAKILLPYRVSMYIMTLYAVFGIGYSLAGSYELDPLSGGMFIGILASFFAVEVYRFTQKSGFKISMPPQVPSSVARSFEALTPTAVVLVAVAAVTMFLGIDVHTIVSKMVSPLVSATDTLPSVLVIIFLEVFFWSFGIHGVSIVGSLARPLWLVLLEGNTSAYVGGETVIHTAAEPFYQWFVRIGGCGATIGLAILFAFFAKSAYGKALGKTSIIPAVFNINEPMIFGAPIVMNPMLVIPFIVTPLVTGTIAWIVTQLGWVNHVVASAPWTLPGPIGAFLACGSDWRAAVLNLVLIALSVVIYYPFFKMYDSSLKAEEQEEG